MTENDFIDLIKRLGENLLISNKHHDLDEYKLTVGQIKTAFRVLQGKKKARQNELPGSKFEGVSN